MWQALRAELAPRGFELVTIGVDTLGEAGCRAFIEAAKPEHPALIDRYHVLADLFGVINIPSGVWIDEAGTIVRPAEAAPAPPRAPGSQPGMKLPADLPQRFKEIMAEAAGIKRDAAGYHAALRDWIALGAQSRFALAPDEVVARSRPRDRDRALGHAHFALASQLEIDGHHTAAIAHFREAHRLVPESWTFRRQAWSLERGIEGPLARLWQGPSEGAPESWPYAGDWLRDIRASGAENYSEPWKP